MADPKAHRLEISRPGLRFVSINMNMRRVRTQTSVRESQTVLCCQTATDFFEKICRQGKIVPYVFGRDISASFAT